MLATILLLKVTLEFQRDLALSEARHWLGAQPDPVDVFLPIGGYNDVEARSYRDLYWEEPEYWFCIGRDMDGRLVAELRFPAPRSIRDQVSYAWIAEKGQTLESLLDTVEVERVIVPAASCPAVTSALSELRSMSLELAPSDEVWLHPRVVEVQVVSSSTNVTVAVVDPNSAIASWFSRAWATLTSCLAPGLASTEYPETLPRAPAVCGSDVVY